MVDSSWFMVTSNGREVQLRKAEGLPGGRLFFEGDLQDHEKLPEGGDVWFSLSIEKSFKFDSFEHR